MSGLYDFITSSIYGGEVPVTEEVKTEEVPVAVAPEVKKEEGKPELNQEQSLEDKKEFIAKQVADQKVNIQVEPHIVADNVKRSKIIDPNTPNFAQTTYQDGDRNVKITYYSSGVGTSIRAKCQLLPNSQIRDGYYEEYHHTGKACLGPIKLKATYVNNKREGYEYHYDQDGNVIKEDFYKDGERVKSWTEWLLGS